MKIHYRRVDVVNKLCLCIKFGEGERGENGDGQEKGGGVCAGADNEIKYSSSGCPSFAKPLTLHFLARCATFSDH